MQQAVIRVWIGLSMLTGLGSIGLVPAWSSDLIEIPTTQPPSTSQRSSSTTQEQGKTENRREAMHRLNEACGEDMKKFCQHVRPGGGRIMQCLEQRQSEISPNCNQLLSKRESQER